VFVLCFPITTVVIFVYANDATSQQSDDPAAKPSNAQQTPNHEQHTNKTPQTT
jgi:hypothetical protein